MRFIFLSIGFLLFVTVTVHAAQGARDRRAVEGRHLIPTSQFASADLQGTTADAVNVAMTPVSAVIVDTPPATDAATAPAHTHADDTAGPKTDDHSANPGKPPAPGHLKHKD
jgi:hypothetical protein